MHDVIKTSVETELLTEVNRQIAFLCLNMI